MSAIGIRGVAFESGIDNAQSAKPDHLVLTLTTLGMAAALVMHATLSQAFQNQLEPGQFFSESIVKPTIYYVAHTLQIALLICAGLVALCSTDFRRIERGYLSRYTFLICAALFMALRGYSANMSLTAAISLRARRLPWDWAAIARSAAAGDCILTRRRSTS